MSKTEPTITPEQIGELLSGITNGWYLDIHRYREQSAEFRIFDKYHQGVCKMTSGGEFHDKPHADFIAAAPAIARLALELVEQRDMLVKTLETRGRPRNRNA